jgi:hypothetical protein
MNNTNVPSANTATGLRRLIDFRPGEGRLIAWAFLYLFAVFSSYYVTALSKTGQGCDVGY